jgi:hypothetical protein
VAKRRNLPGSESEDAEAASAASAEDRRKERKRLRAAREAGNVRAKDRPSWLRRGLIIGVPTAIIIVIIVILLVNPFQPPCLQLQPIPAQSGIPAFPPHNTTNFGDTWCPGASSVFQTYPTLTIMIESTTVGLPSSIGRETNYTSNGAPYDCDLPIQTNTVAQGGLTSNTIYLVSPWAYVYTLGDFFQVWAQSYSNVDVNSSYSSQPITYTTTDLLGFTSDSTHSVTLWVDNQISNQGPSLDLDTLSNAGNVYPSCLGTIYGTGHTILLRYASSGASAAFGSLPPPTLTTSGSPVDLPLLLYDSPSPHVQSTLLLLGMVAYLHEKSLDWLALKAGI